MFWTKKNEPTATDEDRAWVHEALPAVIRSFGTKRLLELPTFIPNPVHFAHTFTGDERDVEFVLGQVCETMQAPRDRIEMKFHDDGSREVAGGIHVSPADRKGYSKGAAGTYQERREGDYIITLSMNTLGNIQRLIATLAHEVAHIELLGERRLAPDDPDHELLTDLTVIAHGYGIFQGNSAFMVNQWQSESHQGWQMQRTGYLPIEVISYAMALLSRLKNDDPDWKRYLSSTMAKYFDRNSAFLGKHPEILAEVHAQLLDGENTEEDGA
ncbi:MAG TPA: hypothetical protein PKY96_03070 [Flavobacteriales bacterium]|nr:hypothetical protein [Flavobacteriales bacterium]